MASTSAMSKLPMELLEPIVRDKELACMYPTLRLVNSAFNDAVYDTFVEEYLERRTVFLLKPQSLQRLKAITSWGLFADHVKTIVLTLHPMQCLPASEIPVEPQGHNRSTTQYDVPDAGNLDQCTGHNRIPDFRVLDSIRMNLNNNGNKIYWSLEIHQVTVEEAPQELDEVVRRSLFSLLNRDRAPPFRRVRFHGMYISHFTLLVAIHECKDTLEDFELSSLTLAQDEGSRAMMMGAGADWDGVLWVLMKCERLKRLALTKVNMSRFQPVPGLNDLGERIVEGQEEIREFLRASFGS